MPRRDAGPAAPLRPMADAWQRHRFFEGLARAVLSTGRPALLVLDDLQWCDEDTLAWLQLLLHLGRDHPLLVVAATRRDEMEGNAELTETLRVLRSGGPGHRGEPGAAGRRAVRRAGQRGAGQQAW